MTSAQTTAGAEAPHGRPWTATETANDLIAQIEDAVASGWQRPALDEALVHQGLEPATATQLVTDIAALPQPDGGAGDPPDVIELLATRMFMRAPHDPLTVLDTRITELAKALEKSGLSAALAAAVTSELAALERRGAETYFGRMRRLGLQGMVVGGATTLLLGYGGLYGGPNARWHLATAAMTLGLFAYSVVLYRRGRPPSRG
ncbi:MAG: hypothetical protein KC502_11730 [Myxococcales bacterium]|nr:hypothetical protein [Myxococcales bacterium]